VIIARASSPDGKMMLIVGLTAGNVARLEDGRPIRVDLARYGLADTELAILYADEAGELIDILNPATTGQTVKQWMGPGEPPPEFFRMGGTGGNGAG